MEPTSIRVCGAQLAVTDDIQTNLDSIRRAIQFARESGAAILLTPEGSLSGYTPHFDRLVVQNGLSQVTEWAKDARIGLALGTCFIEPEDGACYNQLRFYAQDGAFLGFHTKTLTCGSMAPVPEGEINDYRVRPLRTFDFQGVSVGGLICNDLWANPMCTPMPDPHLTHQLAHCGARIIFHAVNGGRDGSEWSQVNWHYHESNLRMRAAVSKIWIVTVDSANPTHLRCSAPSGVVNPDGNWACQADAIGEQFFAFTIDLE
jgi:predicted amidohydrolase